MTMTTTNLTAKQAEMLKALNESGTLTTLKGIEKVTMRALAAKGLARRTSSNTWESVR